MTSRIDQLRAAAKRFDAATKRVEQRGTIAAPSEQWRPAACYDGYEVSTLGRVVSYRQTRPRIVEPGLDDGRTTVVLTRPGNKTRRVNLGALILDSFGVQRPPGRIACCHRDDDDKNFALDNLYWGRTKHPIFGTPEERKERNARITEALAGGMPTRTAARVFGTHRNVVRKLAAELRTPSVQHVKSHMLSSTVRAAVLADIRAGLSNAQVAHNNGVSSASVSRIKTEFGLARSWTRGRRTQHAEAAE
jgi:hypothetical protein